MKNTKYGCFCWQWWLHSYGCELYYLMLMHECAPSVERTPCSKWLPRVEVERLDAEVAQLARKVSAQRLSLGEALEALGKNGGHHELGFSSFRAYSIERCEKSGRWAADTTAAGRIASAAGSVASGAAELVCGGVAIAAWRRRRTGRAVGSGAAEYGETAARGVVRRKTKAASKANPYGDGEPTGRLVARSDQDAPAALGCGAER